MSKLPAMHTLSWPLLLQSWRDWLGSADEPVGPRWLPWFWTFDFSAVVAVGFTILGFAAFAHGEGAWRNLSGWWHWYKINLVVALAIGLLTHGLFSFAKRLLTRARVRALTGFARIAYFNGIPLLGVAIGWPLGATLVGYDAITWRLLQDSNALFASISLALVIAGVISLLFSASARRLQAEKKAAQAQLRLLQAQIEPHFLFNTLANVVALIDTDAPRAKHMLESFTDYLRASLATLRHEHATLGSELALARHYLELLQQRMEDRLHFTLDVPADLLDARLPPLLVQPLVENAVHHGLEPKVEGGTVRVTAALDGAHTLVIRIEDDGLGLNPNPAATHRRKGTGLGLANVRERLSTHFGNTASLALSTSTSATSGTVATLRLPLQRGEPA